MGRGPGKAGTLAMDMAGKQRSALTETLQSGLPTWTDRADTALALPEVLRACDRFFYHAFGECLLPVMIYDDQGRRLVHPLEVGEARRFPERIEALADRTSGPGFVMCDRGPVYVYNRFDRWPLAPANVASVAVLIERDWFIDCTGLELTRSEFTLVGLLLSGHDLRSAAAHVGASYDTKRKQVRLILEKAGVSGQAALLRELSLALSSTILNDLIRPDLRSPEVDLVQQVYGRDVVIHTISVGTSRDVPVWGFGARQGQPILYFHSMLAPIMFTPDMAKTLSAHNLRLLMIPRHFFEPKSGFELKSGLKPKPGAASPQTQILQAASEIVDYFCGEPVICMGESAGCAWAAQFARHYPDQVSEVIFVATPQAIRLQDAARTLSRSASLLTEVSTRIRRDDRVVAGLTRVYNTIARVPALARKSLAFMLRKAPSDLASIDVAFASLALGDWLRLIANKAARASVDEVAHLHSDWVSDLHRLTRPMRFFHGSEDTLCPLEDARAMAAGLPDARFTAFKGAGHLVLGQRLDEILASLFVTQNPSENVTEQSV